MNTKVVSQLDSDGCFVGQTTADESPLESGVWLLPAGAVDSLPPSLSPGQRAKWTGSGFDLEAIPAPEVPPPPPPPTTEQLQAQYIAALDAHIDAKARARGYDSRVTCALRAGYPGPFQAEGQAFAQWMDACYATGQQALAAVLAGQRPMPTTEAFFDELPPMVWPEAVK